MNHRCCRRQAPPFDRRKPAKLILVVAVALLGCLAALPLQTAEGQASPRSVSIPPAVKTATDARPSASQIEAYVKAQVAQIKNVKDADAQKRARDALVRESAAAGVAPSASYLSVYAKTVNDQLLPLANEKVQPAARLNAAVAIARVAKNANNGELAPAAAAFASDPCVGVALWGVKASQYILPPLALAGKPEGSKLSAAVVAAVKKHPRSGDVVFEAYRGVTLFTDKNVTDKSVPIILPDAIKLFEFRVGLYAQQTPPNLEAERLGINFLTLKDVWQTKIGAQMRPAIMQQIFNLMSLSAAHAVVKEDNKIFLEHLKGIGDALMAIADPTRLNDTALFEAGKKLFEITGSTSDIEERAAAAAEAIKAKFPTIKPAPTLSDIAATGPTVEEQEEAEQAEKDKEKNPSAPKVRDPADAPDAEGAAPRPDPKPTQSKPGPGPTKPAGPR